MPSWTTYGVVTVRTLLSWPVWHLCPFSWHQEQPCSKCLTTCCSPVVLCSVLVRLQCYALVRLDQIWLVRHEPSHPMQDSLGWCYATIQMRQLLFETGPLAAGRCSHKLLAVFPTVCLCKSGFASLFKQSIGLC